MVIVIWHTKHIQYVVLLQTIQCNTTCVLHKTNKACLNQN